MNISFQNKIALSVICLAAALVGMWRYELRVQEPRQNAFVTSLQDNLRERDDIEGTLQELKKIQANVERVAAQGKVDASVEASLNQSLDGVFRAGETLFANGQNPFKQLTSDVSEFLQITRQLSLYEAKVTEFIGGFKSYFQNFEKAVKRWNESTAVAIAAGGVVSNSIPFFELDQKISAIEKVIPEFSFFNQKLQSLEKGFDQWTKDIDAAATVDEKRQIFAQKQFLTKGVSELFGTFDRYVLASLNKERANAQEIGRQINFSMTAIQTQVEEKFAVKNNAVQTVMAQTKYRDEQYKKVKYIVVGLIFTGLIGLFFAMTIYSFKFEKGLVIFKLQTFKAAQTSRQISATLKDNSTLVIKNFDLARTLKEGLEDVSGGFRERQNNLQQIDQIVRDTDVLIKESQQNFVHIKDEFYNAEKVSKEIVHLTGALEGIAHQMTSVADRISLNIAHNPQQADGKENTIDELKYLAGRIRFAVNATHTTLSGRTEKIEEAKAKFTLIENNMAQMTENTKQALRGLAVARLDHSEEVSRINDILENTKTTSRVIADEIESLNKQINDFSVLSQHLAALHELAVKASALNSKSLLAQEEPAAPESTTSDRMNDYVQEYFKRNFESASLKVKQDETSAAESDAKPPVSRIQSSAEV